MKAPSSSGEFGTRRNARTTLGHGWFGSVTGTITRAYDGLDRLTSETTPQDGVSYSYDNASQLSAINYQVGSNSLGNLTYTYDPAERRTSAVDK
jgi:YD repeat-containing protein